MTFPSHWPWISGRLSFLMLGKFQNPWYLKRRVFSECSFCFSVVSGALTILPSTLNQLMHQFKISYQILLLHEPYWGELLFLTLSDTLFLPMEYKWNLLDLIAVVLNQSYLGANSLTEMIKLKTWVRTNVKKESELLRIVANCSCRKAAHLVWIATSLGINIGTQKNGSESQNKSASTALCWTYKVSRSLLHIQYGNTFFEKKGKKRKGWRDLMNIYQVACFLFSE